MGIYTLKLQVGNDGVQAQILCTEYPEIMRSGHHQHRNIIAEESNGLTNTNKLKSQQAAWPETRAKTRIVCPPDAAGHCPAAAQGAAV